MKTCRLCKEQKTLDSYHFNNTTKDGRDARCKPCRQTEASSDYKANPFKTLARCKKAECKKKGIPYDLDAEYLSKLWTGKCPVFNIAITIGNSGYGSHKSGHLDRIDPEMGYTKGNVKYISGRANRIKYNATRAELEMIIEYMKSHESATTIPKGSTSEAIADGSAQPLGD